MYTLQAVRALKFCASLHLDLDPFLIPVKASSHILILSILLDLTPIPDNFFILSIAEEIQRLTNNTLLTVEVLK